MCYISIGSAGPDSCTLFGRACGPLAHSGLSWVEPCCLGTGDKYLVKRQELALAFSAGISGVNGKKIQKEKVVCDGRGGDHKVVQDTHLRSKEAGGFLT